MYTSKVILKFQLRASLGAKVEIGRLVGLTDMRKVIPKFQLRASLGAKVEIGCPVSQKFQLKLTSKSPY